MDRRSFLTSVPAAIGASALPAIADAETVRPDPANLTTELVYHAFAINEILRKTAPEGSQLKGFGYRNDEYNGINAESIWASAITPDYRLVHFRPMYSEEWRESRIKQVDAEAVPRSKVQKLFEQHQKLTDQAERYETTWDSPDQELDFMFYNRRDEIERQMLEEPSQSAADFAAKMIAVTAKGGFMPDWDNDPVWKEARALTGGLV